MESLELRVKILLLVCAVSECVQADAIFVVWGHIPHLYGVPALDHIRFSQGNNLVLERLWSDGNSPVINLKVSYCKSL